MPLKKKNEKKKPGSESKSKSKSKKNRYKKCLGECHPKAITQPSQCEEDDGMEWQMSPFPNERFDLDEIQRLEKKGVKGKQELEALKKKLAGKNESEASDAEDTATKSKAQKQKATPSTSEAPATPGMDTSCTPEILYQPYGPLIAPGRSYARPFNNKRSVYGYLGPSFYTAYRFKVPAPSVISPTPCPEQDPRMPPNLADLSPYSFAYGNFYVPLGP